jgi:hypothetical protein
MLLLPLIEPPRLLQSLKGYTSREANRHLGRTGEPFWQKESYDHWVRDPAEWDRIAADIENSPGAGRARGVARSGDAAR